MFTFGRHLIGDSIEIFKCRQSIVFSFFFVTFGYTATTMISLAHMKSIVHFSREKTRNGLYWNHFNRSRLTIFVCGVCARACVCVRFLPYTLYLCVYIWYCQCGATHRTVKYNHKFGLNNSGNNTKRLRQHHHHHRQQQQQQRHSQVFVHLQSIHTTIKDD